MDINNSAKIAATAGLCFVAGLLLAPWLIPPKPMAAASTESPRCDAVTTAAPPDEAMPPDSLSRTVPLADFDLPAPQPSPAPPTSESDTLYHTLVQNTDAADNPARERYLKAIALLNTPDARASALQVMLDTNEAQGLRVEMIRLFDWSDAINEAIELLDSGDDAVARAVIAAIQSTEQLSAQDRSLFSSRLESIFDDDHAPFTEIAALDYFANTAPERLNTLSLQNRDPAVLALLNQHLTEIQNHNDHNSLP